MLSPRLAQRLFGVVVVLTVLGAVSVLVDAGALALPGGKAFVNLFDLNKENTVPAWFSSVLLLTVSGLGWLVSQQDTAHARKHRRLWQLFSVLFAGLSLDESAAIHERLQSVAEHHGASHTTGLLTFIWVVPALLLCAALGVLYLRFVFDLDLRTRLMLIAAGILYVGGAAGMEMIDGWVFSHFGKGSFYLALTVVEEFCEMSGAALCAGTLQRILLASSPSLFSAPATAQPTVRLVTPAAGGQA